MHGAKHWQIALLVLAIVALGVSTWFTISSYSDGITQSTTAVLIDINTGELLTTPLPERAVIFPATNPETSANTLVPVYEEGGKWFLISLYGSYATDEKGKLRPIVLDKSTLEVKPTSSIPKEVNLFDDQ